MAANHIANTNFGTKLLGQGTVIAVRGWLASALRAISAEASGLFLSRGYRHALSLKRMPAATAFAPVTCRTISDRRLQRHRRWMSGVVVDPGTVGAR